MRFDCRTEDLELYAYDFLEGGERDRVDVHLETCPRCRTAVRTLLEEKTIVTFELSLAVGATDAVPEPPREGSHSRRRWRPAFLVTAAAAAVILIVSVGVRSLRPVGETALTSWAELPDGSRYRVLGTAEVRQGSGLRRLDLDAGSLLLDVRPGGGVFEVRTRSATVKTEAGRLAISVTERGTIVEVLEGLARVEPEEGEPRWIPPRVEGEPWIVVVELDPDPELLARIAELEALLLAARQDPDETPALPDDPEEAIERHDWSGLAQSVAEMGAGLREGRLPEDPAVIRRYLRSIQALRRLARVASTPTTIEEVTRDPRTGPKLFREVLRHAWPDAPETDIAAAEAAAEREIVEYGRKKEVAETSAARAAAEEDLRAGLAREIEDLEEKHGPPAVDVEPVLPEETEGEGGSGSGGEQGNAAPVDDTPGPEGAELAGGAPSFAAKVLDAANFSAPPERVIRGDAASAAKQAADAWRRDMGASGGILPGLVEIASGWVRDYAKTLRTASPRVAEALEAELEGAEPPAGVSASQVIELRAALLRLQDSAELAVRGLLGERDAADWPSVPTFFLFTD
ncbi:MAG: FecR domain-containing protein [Planctomycetota bacterium]|jgi:hypothetical protein